MSFLASDAGSRRGIYVADEAKRLAKIRPVKAKLEAEVRAAVEEERRRRAKMEKRLVKGKPQGAWPAAAPL